MMLFRECRGGLAGIETSLAESAHTHSTTGKALCVVSEWIVGVSRKR